ncbi:MAG TPA: acyl-CoA dehydrogenase family protein, partial [Thermoanaerobaculia bacterium]|nr:acyl-CoA dehydrogenase family protein [Thermoanaerobaculia bacterium]
MEFTLTSEQLAVQETARAFARREVDPIVEETDEAQRFPREVMRKAGELGFLGVIFPEELGGAGLGYVDYVLMVTELSK